MKKLLVLFLSCLLLVGCSNGGASAGKTAVCTMDLSEDGMTGSMVVTLKAEKDVVSSMTMDFNMDLSSYDEATQQIIKTALDSELLSQYNGDGVTSKSDIKDGSYVLTVDIADMEKAGNVFGGTADYANTKLEDVVKEAESSGATCK